jgi:hypothetical protein
VRLGTGCVGLRDAPDQQADQRTLDDAVDVAIADAIHANDGIPAHLQRLLPDHEPHRLVAGLQQRHAPLLSVAVNDVDLFVNCLGEASEIRELFGWKQWRRHRHDADEQRHDQKLHGVLLVRRSPTGTSGR